MIDWAVVADRFWPRVDMSGDCWIWRGAIKSNGYGHMSNLDGKTIGVHRIAWILTFGPIPDGLVVCHRCDVRPCVRPAHLFLGTTHDNMVDMSIKGRGRKPRPFCHVGHENIPENRTKAGRCRICSVKRNDGYQRARRARLAADPVAWEAHQVIRRAKSREVRERMRT